MMPISAGADTRQPYFHITFAQPFRIAKYFRLMGHPIYFLVFLELRTKFDTLA
jgi:hypothetical protein